MLGVHWRMLFIERAWSILPNLCEYVKQILLRVARGLSSRTTSTAVALGRFDLSETLSRQLNLSEIGLPVALG
jgi:hypothetical protein